MTPVSPDRPSEVETPKGFMSIRDYSEYRDKIMKQADELIAKGKAGPLTDADKRDLADVVSDLRNILRIQLDPNQPIRRRDLSDGNYSNVMKDRHLRTQIRILRNLDIDLHGTWGTRFFQKFLLFFKEDAPNYIGIEYRRIKDHVNQYLRIAGVAGIVTGLGYATYGAVNAGMTGGWAAVPLGAGSGLLTFGKHLAYVGKGLGSGVQSGWNFLFGGKKAKK